MLNSLIQCIVWGQVNPRLRRTLLLSAAMSVSSFRICLLLNEVQRSSHVKPRRPFDAVHLKPCLFICQTTRKIRRTRHKWNWYQISQFRSLMHIVMSSAINKRWFIFTLRTLICIRQKWNLKPFSTQCVTQQCFWYNSHSWQTFCLPVSPVNV